MKRLCGEAKGNALFVTNVQDRIDYHTISCTSSSVYLTMLLMWLRRLDERGGRRPQYQPRHQRGVEGYSLPSDQVASDFPYTLVFSVSLRFPHSSLSCIVLVARFLLSCVSLRAASFALPPVIVWTSNV